MQSVPGLGRLDYAGLDAYCWVGIDKRSVFGGLRLGGCCVCLQPRSDKPIKR